MTGHRIFDGFYSVGELCWLPNTLEGEGAETVIHAHKFPHAMWLEPGNRDEKSDRVYEVYAIGSDGKPRQLEKVRNQWVYIEAGIEHRVRLVKGDRGAFVCFFSKWGPDGYRVDALAPYEGA